MTHGFGTAFAVLSIACLLERGMVVWCPLDCIEMTGGCNQFALVSLCLCACHIWCTMHFIWMGVCVPTVLWQCMRALFADTSDTCSVFVGVCDLAIGYCTPLTHALIHWDLFTCEKSGPVIWADPIWVNYGLFPAVKSARKWPRKCREFIERWEVSEFGRRWICMKAYLNPQRFHTLCNVWAHPFLSAQRVDCIRSVNE